MNTWEGYRLEKWMNLWIWAEVEAAEAWWVMDRPPLSSLSAGQSPADSAEASQASSGSGWLLQSEQSIVQEMLVRPRQLTMNESDENHKDDCLHEDQGDVVL